jgi:hypothetical protein
MGSLRHLDVDGRIILKYIVKKQDGSVRTGLILLNIGISAGLLWAH